MAIKTVVPGATDLSIDASWSGGSLPSAGDVGYLNEGSATIVTGLTAVALNRFVVTSTFRGKLGTASSPVAMRVDNGPAPKWEIEGGTYHNIAAHTSGGVTTLVINAPGVPVYLGGTGTFATVKAMSGAVEVGAGCVVTTLINNGATTRVYDNATSITTLVASSGRVVSHRSVTTWTQDGSAQGILLDDEAITTLNIGGNSIFNHQSNGTITTMNMYGRGDYTPAGALQDTVVTTINKYGQGRLVGQAKQIRLTYSTLNDFAEGGAVVDSFLGLDSNI